MSLFLHRQLGLISRIEVVNSMGRICGFFFAIVLSCENGKQAYKESGRKKPRKPNHT